MHAVNDLFLEEFTLDNMIRRGNGLVWTTGMGLGPGAAFKNAGVLTLDRAIKTPRLTIV